MSNHEEKAPLPFGEVVEESPGQLIESGRNRATSAEKVVSIKCFPGDPYTVLEPIPVEILPIDHGTVEVRFTEGNLGWSDGTIEEAVEVLKEVILSTMEDLEEHEAILGPDARQQLAVLRKHLKKC